MDFFEVVDTLSGCPIDIKNINKTYLLLSERGRSPHEGRTARGEWPLSVTEGTSRRVVLFLLYPPTH